MSEVNERNEAEVGELVRRLSERPLEELVEELWNWVKENEEALKDIDAGPLGIEEDLYDPEFSNPVFLGQADIYYNYQIRDLLEALEREGYIDKKVDDLEQLFQELFRETAALRKNNSFLHLDLLLHYASEEWHRHVIDRIREKLSERGIDPEDPEARVVIKDIVEQELGVKLEKILEAEKHYRRIFADIKELHFQGFEHMDGLYRQHVRYAATFGELLGLLQVAKLNSVADGNLDLEASVSRTLNRMYTLRSIHAGAKDALKPALNLASVDELGKFWRNLPVEAPVTMSKVLPVVRAMEIVTGTSGLSGVKAGFPLQKLAFALHRTGVKLALAEHYHRNHRHEHEEVEQSIIELEGMLPEFTGKQLKRLGNRFSRQHRQALSLVENDRVLPRFFEGVVSKVKERLLEVEDAIRRNRDAMIEAIKKTDGLSDEEKRAKIEILASEDIDAGLLMRGLPVSRLPEPVVEAVKKLKEVDLSSEKSIALDVEEKQINRAGKLVPLVTSLALVSMLSNGVIKPEAVNAGMINRVTGASVPEVLVETAQECGRQLPSGKEESIIEAEDIVEVIDSLKQLPSGKEEGEVIDAEVVDDLPEEYLKRFRRKPDYDVYRAVMERYVIRKAMSEFGLVPKPKVVSYLSTKGRIGRGLALQMMNTSKYVGVFLPYRKVFWALTDCITDVVVHNRPWEHYRQCIKKAKSEVYRKRAEYASIVDAMYHGTPHAIILAPYVFLAMWASHYAVTAVKHLKYADMRVNAMYKELLSRYYIEKDPDKLVFEITKRMLTDVAAGTHHVSLANDPTAREVMPENRKLRNIAEELRRLLLETNDRTLLRTRAEEQVQEWLAATGDGSKLEKEYGRPLIGFALKVNEDIVTNVAIDPKIVALRTMFLSLTAKRMKQKQVPFRGDYRELLISSSAEDIEEAAQEARRAVKELVKAALAGNITDEVSEMLYGTSVKDLQASLKQAVQGTVAETREELVKKQMNNVERELVKKALEARTFEKLRPITRKYLEDFKINTPDGESVKIRSFIGEIVKQGIVEAIIEAADIREVKPTPVKVDEEKQQFREVTKAQHTDLETTVDNMLEYETNELLSSGR